MVTNTNKLKKVRAWEKAEDPALKREIPMPSGNNSRSMSPTPPLIYGQHPRLISQSFALAKWRCATQTHNAERRETIISRPVNHDHIYSKFSPTYNRSRTMTGDAPTPATGWWAGEQNTTAVNRWTAWQRNDPVSRTLYPFSERQVNRVCSSIPNLAYRNITVEHE